MFGFSVDAVKNYCGIASQGGGRGGGGVGGAAYSRRTCKRCMILFVGIIIHKYSMR